MHGMSVFSANSEKLWHLSFWHFSQNLVSRSRLPLLCVTHSASHRGPCVDAQKGCQGFSTAKPKNKPSLFEFSLNVSLNSANSVTKNIIILKRCCCIQTNYLLCERQIFYHCATETQLTEKTVKLFHIHASVIYQILWIHWIQWKFCYIWGKPQCSCVLVPRQVQFERKFF